MVKNLKMTNKITSMLLTGTLAFTLIGCTNTQTKEEPTSQPAIEKTEENKDWLFEKHDESAVETAIDLMITEAENLSEASEEAKQTESYQKAKEESLKNFDDLFNFIFNDKEIAGYTIDEVSDNIVNKAKETLSQLDQYIETYIPDYKYKIKEKLNTAKEFLEDKGTDVLSWAADKYDDIKQKVKEKRNK